MPGSAGRRKKNEPSVYGKSTIRAIKHGQRSISINGGSTHARYHVGTRTGINRHVMESPRIVLKSFGVSSPAVTRERRNPAIPPYPMIIQRLDLRPKKHSLSHHPWNYVISPSCVSIVARTCAHRGFKPPVRCRKTAPERLDCSLPIWAGQPIVKEIWFSTPQSGHASHYRGKSR